MSNISNYRIKVKQILLIFFGLISGILAGLVILSGVERSLSVPVSVPTAKPKKEVLGFLPYWLLDKAKPNYSGFITTLDYFSLTLDTDGTILKSTNPVELEPGYAALTGGKLDPFFDIARQDNIKLSLTVFDGDQDSINQLISDPITHADNLIADISPIMSKYAFSDLNLDIESVAYASPSAQINYKSL